MKHRASSGGGVVPAGAVIYERKASGGRVVEAVGVALERVHSGGRVGAATGVAIQRLIAEGRVAYAARQTEESISALSGVVPIPSVRWWIDRLRVLDERKADEPKYD